MAGYPCIAIEIATSGSTIYLCSHPFTSQSGDTPASTTFEPRLMRDVTFERTVGTVFWKQASRGAQNFGTIDINNADGGYDSLAGVSLRDNAVTIKRGESADAYSTFSTVATLIVDRVELQDETVVRVYVKDLSAKLERAIQTSLYPTTLSNGALRGKPRPITIGKCYQIVPQQPDMYGNGRYDLHDSDQWVGVDQWLDQGATIVESVGYERCRTSGIYGIERLTAIGAKQAANVAGAFVIISTDVTDDFTSLAGWTVGSGGVGGRDATIVSNELRLLNTAGGADLTVTSTTTVTSVATDFWFYEFDCTSFTSGSAKFGESTITEKTIDKTGRYTGIVRSSANFAPKFTASNGSNCDLRVDNFRLRKVRLIEKLSDWLTYVTVTKGPLSSGDLDSSTISTMETAAPYTLGFWASEPTQIAAVLDQTMQSFGGWWYVTRLGKLTIGRLTAPSGSPAWTFTSDNIAPGMSIEFDAAPGLSNMIGAKRNWSPFADSELVPAVNAYALSTTDKDADVTVASDAYSYSASNVGSVRDTPSHFGGRVYLELTMTAVDGAATHYVGWGSSSASITGYPGQDANAVAYRANGKTVQSASESTYGNTWTTNDVIGIAIDMRPAANGSRRNAFRLYWRKNGTWQNSSDPSAETNPVYAASGTLALAYLMCGSNVAGTNSASVNFGQAAFTYAPPDDYLAPAWHRQACMATFRYRYQTTTSFAAAYTHANNASGDGADPEGIATLLTKEADARTECDRWGSLYASERFFYTFDALLDSGVSSDQIEVGDLISVTYPRFGLSSKLLRVVGVKGSMLSRRVTITGWG